MFFPRATRLMIPLIGRGDDDDVVDEGKANHVPPPFPQLFTQVFKMTADEERRHDVAGGIVKTSRINERKELFPDL